MVNKALGIIYPKFAEMRASVGFLFFRILFGVGIAMHGYGKIGNLEGMAEGLGIPVALAAMAMMTELAGGILIVLGALTPLVSFMLAGNMTVAALTHITAGDPFLVGPNGPDTYNQGWEFAALYLFGFAMMFFTGPGKISVDYLVVEKSLGVQPEY